MRDLRDRLYELEATVEESTTETQHNSRSAILNRIKYHLRHSGDKTDILYANLIRDWPTFLAFELDTIEGVPVFLSQWQLDADAQTEDYDDIWANCSRQVGKTLWEATLALKEMMWHKNTAVLAIAPTQEQLVVRDNFRHFVNTSEFIRETFLGDGDNRQEFIRFAANNSSFMPINLSGDFKRGKTGNVVMIDEYQLLTREKYMTVVHPMLSSNFSRRKLYRFMTPSYLYQPDLDKSWDRAKASKNVLAIEVNIWQGLDEGIKKATREEGAGSIQEIFEEEKIDCPFVNVCGACPGFVPQLFDGEAKECRMCFSDSDSFLQEYMAAFPKQSELYFATQWMHELRIDKPLLAEAEIAKLTVPKVMGIDLGGLADPTEIVINTVTEGAGGTPHMTTVGRRHIGPIGGRGEMPSLAKIVWGIKHAYKNVQPEMIIMDVTSKHHVAQELITGEEAIPRSVFYTNETAKKNSLPGLWQSGPEKERVYQNHRLMIAQKHLQVYSGSPDFWKMYFDQHTAVRAIKDGATSYTKFKMPKQDHLVDAAALASYYVMAVAGQRHTSHEFEFVPRKGL